MPFYTKSKNLSEKESIPGDNKEAGWAKVSFYPRRQRSTWNNAKEMAKEYGRQKNSLLM